MPKITKGFESVPAAGNDPPVKNVTKPAKMFDLVIKNGEYIICSPNRWNKKGEKFITKGTMAELTQYCKKEGIEFRIAQF